jgi:hypothetical protein
VLGLQQNNEGQPQQQVLLMLHDDKVGYCNLDGTLKLKKRKRVPTDEPRPAKVGVLVVCVKHMSVCVCVGGGCRSLSGSGSRIDGMGLCSTPAGCA